MSDQINLADVKCGDRFWECAEGKNIELEAMSDAFQVGDLVQCQARQAWQADLDGCQTMPGYTKELEWQLGSLLELAEQGTMDDVQLFAKIVRSIGFSTYPPRKAMAWLADYRERAAARRKEKETNDGE